MIVDVEKKEAIENLKTRWEKVLAFLKIDEKKEQLNFIQKQLADDNFWSSNNLSQAQNLQREAKEIERSLSSVKAGQIIIDELNDIFEFCKASDFSVEEEAEWTQELNGILEKAQKLVDTEELQAFLSDPRDANNAIVTIHAGVISAITPSEGLFLRIPSRTAIVKVGWSTQWILSTTVTEYP